MRVLVAVLLVAAVVPVARLVGMLLGDGTELAREAEQQSLASVELPALRGAVVDRNGFDLAVSLPRVRVAANNAELDELAAEDPTAPGTFVSTLAEGLDVDEQDLIARMDAAGPDDPWVELVAAVVPERADAVREAITEVGLLPALVLEDTSVREHPAGESALRVVGTVGESGPGRFAGVERMLDAELQGRPGRKTMEEGPRGDVIAGSERVVEEAEPGATVRLTLDRTVQYETERILAAGVAAAGARSGVAIVGRPGTGELLAVAAVETDPDTAEVGLAGSPKAFTDTYQAGSVFKIVPISAAIEDGHVSVGSVLQVPDHIEVYDRPFTDHDPHPTQPMTVQEILAQSSNVGSIKVAQTIGPARLHDALVDFGFGRPSGVANPAESAGVLPPLDEWNGPDYAAAAIGTFQSATALQLWSAYNVIANRGTYVSPRLVQDVVRSDGSSAPTGEANETRRVVSEQTAEQVEQALRSVITEGTGRQWNIPGYPSAAKTGTSRMPAPERVDPRDGYMWSDGRYHYLNAFTGYLPADDPQVSITVLLEDVAGGLTGATGAGPVFYDLARLGIRELGIAPTADGASVGDAPLRAPAAGTAAAVTGTALGDTAGDAAGTAAGTDVGDTAGTTAGTGATTRSSTVPTRATTDAPDG
jgi:cell division protein FtsI (penicillin-binding protein 3)